LWCIPSAYAEDGGKQALISLDSTAWKLKWLNPADLKRFDEAIKAYDKEIEINPLDKGVWNIWYLKGLAYCK